tara:strand:- start:51 stop:356 length:306 start_codon:yes stop_codon:yes gene_type:complete
MGRFEEINPRTVDGANWLKENVERVLHETLNGTTPLIDKILFDFSKINTMSGADAFHSISETMQIGGVPFVLLFMSLFLCCAKHMYVRHAVKKMTAVQKIE